MERAGTVKWMTASFPMRLAVILVSATGAGRKSEGECGGPGLAQPASMSASAGNTAISPEMRELA